MKTIFVLPSLRQGGAEKVFSKNVKNWQTNDCQLVILEKVRSGELDNYGLSSEKVISLGKSRSITALYSLYRHFKELNVQFVFSTLTHVNIIVLFLSFFYRAKFYIREASVFSLMSEFDKRKWITEKLIRILYPRADKIICQSNDIKEDLRKILDIKEEKFTIINNPIEISEIPLCDERQSNDLLKMVYVARFGPEKGHLRLVNILKDVERPFHLKLIGDGPLLDECKNRILYNDLNDTVSFEGWVSPPYPEMKDCDLYIQPSYVEGFPNALMEACAMGMPAIAYNVPGGTKEIINKNNGRLIEDGNSTKFAKAIDDFTTKDYDSEWIRMDIDRRYSYDKILGQYQSLV